MKKTARISALCLMALAFSFCKQKGDTDNGQQSQNKPAKEAPVVAPEFNEDTAYAIIEKQVSFGPRVPNTPAHEKAADYLINKLKQYTDKVEVQKGQVTAFDGKKLNITNIFGYFYPNSPRKILLVSHYDSRPFADQDSVNKTQPIIAANDGASGIGVMMEIARQLHTKDPGVGVILFFTDAEDYGTPDYDTTHSDRDTYCLGTQYWANHLDKSQYFADYGIVLDMVGAPQARFLQEANSLDKPVKKDFVYRVWSTAYKLGHNDHFIMNQSQYGVIDDHVYVSQLAGIPCIDVVDYDANRPKGFDYYWHTHQDDMAIIDKKTLNAVGETLLALFFDMGGKPVQ